MSIRRKISIGIYLDDSGIRAIVNCADGRKEKRFDADTELSEIKRWRSDTKSKLETLHPRSAPAPSAAAPSAPTSSAT